MINCDQEEAKIKPTNAIEGQTAVEVRPHPMFGALNQNKLHIRSFRKVDQVTVLGSQGFEEEKVSKTDDDLVLSDKQNKILHLSQRNTVDLTKQKVSLLKNGNLPAKKSDDQPMSAQQDAATHKKRKFGEIISDDNMQKPTHTEEVQSGKSSKRLLKNPTEQDGDSKN